MARRVIVALLAAGVLAPLACLGPAAAAATRPATPYDVDGDGRQELVASAPGLTVGSMGEGAGGVVVMPTTTSGLSRHGRLLTQGMPGIIYEPVEGGNFGDGVTSADFNRDGYADLVVYTPFYEGFGTTVGVLTIIPGSSHGLDPTRSRVIGRTVGQDDDQTGISGVVVAGDFTADGYPDLSVGVPGANHQAVRGESYGASGEVLVFAGGPKGLAPTPARVLERQRPVGGHQDWDNGFGSSLGAGDLNGDGRTDLVVGSSGDNGTYGSYPGSVTVCPGAPGGPTWCRRLAHSADYSGPTSFAVGRVTGAARPDLVVAVPDPAKDAPGSVRILQFEPTGAPTVARALVLAQSSRGVPGGDEPNDAFGTALAVADLDRDGFADLVVGAPGENDGRGRVTIVHGARGGWRTHGNSSLSQATKGVPGKAEAKDRFGASLTLLDHTGRGRLDLDVGSPGENGSGSVTDLRGTGTGFTTSGATVVDLTTLGVMDRANAHFGDPLGH